MAKYRTRSRNRSRLDRIESKRFTRQAIVFIVLTIAAILLVIFVGIPAFIRLAIILGEVRQSPDSEQVQSIPPSAPRLTTPPRATNSASLSINAFSQSGYEVVLFQNNRQTKESVADESGMAQFSGLTLEEGDNYFYALAINPRGLESDRSNQVAINLISQPPEIVIDSPDDGQRFFGASERTIEVAGQTDPGVSLYLNERMIVVNRDGSFQSNYFLEEGDNELAFEVIDEAGNRSEESLNVRFSP